MRPFSPGSKSNRLAITPRSATRGTPPDRPHRRDASERHGAGARAEHHVAGDPLVNRASANGAMG